MRQGSLKDLAYQEIKEVLLNGGLEADRLYSAQHFAQILGVSRTPVREALLRLANEGFLVCQDVKGFKVKKFSPQEALDILETRQLIETYVVERLAGCLDVADLKHLQMCHMQMADCAAKGDPTGFIEADQEFHMSLMRRCGNQHLFAIMDNIRSRIAVFGLKALGRQEDFQDVIEEHTLILNALQLKSKKQAAQAMRNHLATTQRRLLEGAETREVSSI